MPELTEQARGWLADLKSTFETRKRDYGWAELVGGYSTSEAEPVLAHLVVRLHPNGDDRKKSRSVYSHFTLFSEPVEPEVGWKVFESLAKDEQLRIGDWSPTMGFRRGTVDQPARHDSRSYPFDEAWPLDVGLLSGTPDGRLRHELLASKDGPLFTGPQEAINEETRVPVGWRGFSPTVYILMPDRRVRIASVRVTGSAISGQIERGPVPVDGLILKAYVSTVNSTVRARERPAAFPPPSRFELDEPSGSFSFETGFYPAHFILTLVEKGSNLALDKREYESGRFCLANDIAFEADATQIEDLIQGGESERVEFKQNFEGDSKWLRTVCAFANGQGGTIFFGVADDTSIQGLDNPRSVDWVAQRIRDSVEPFPVYQYKVTAVQGKKVAYVDVPAGAETPYMVRDQGTYVRVQASTRQATRNELLLLARAAIEGNPRRRLASDSFA